ncbi:hypothetical protein ACIBPB_07730 [Micromonospora sp. NPDC049836]|uniref:hypothetical protein n=1 Tax=Micromonospora sp. NPDC049836 TaxID=3364274 RepID=UPI0037A7A9B7
MGRPRHAMSWHRREFDRKEKDIVRFRKPQRASAVVAIVAVLALAVTLFLSRGVMDAVLMVVIVAVLAGPLRRYARAVRLYPRRSALPRRHADSGLVSSAPAAGGASAGDPGGTPEPHAPDRT